MFAHQHVEEAERYLATVPDIDLDVHLDVQTRIALAQAHAACGAARALNELAGMATGDYGIQVTVMNR